MENSPKLAHAYYLKELFREIYQSKNKAEAKELLFIWLQKAESSPFNSFHTLAKTIRRWLQEILNYFDLQYTNSRTEGTNNKIKNIKRRAYGYRNLGRFRTRVMLECTGNERTRPFIDLLELIAN